MVALAGTVNVPAQRTVRKSDVLPTDGIKPSNYPDFLTLSNVMCVGGS